MLQTPFYDPTKSYEENYDNGPFSAFTDGEVFEQKGEPQYAYHPFPNILSVHADGDLTLERLKSPLIADTNYSQPLAITNSFNIPSKNVATWQEDMKKANEAAGVGQVLVGSF